jgi:hypothetical protein
VRGRYRHGYRTEALARTECPPPGAPPTVVRDRRRYTRIAYLHLGKLDCLKALGGLLTAVASVDRETATEG